MQAALRAPTAARGPPAFRARTLSRSWTRPPPRMIQSMSGRSTAAAVVRHARQRMRIRRRARQRLRGRQRAQRQLRGRRRARRRVQMRRWRQVRPWVLVTAAPGRRASRWRCQRGTPRYSLWDCSLGRRSRRRSPWRGRWRRSRLRPRCRRRPWQRRMRRSLWRGRRCRSRLWPGSWCRSRLQPGSWCCPWGGRQRGLWRGRWCRHRWHLRGCLRLQYHQRRW